MGAPVGVTQGEGHTGFPHLSSSMLALTFIARRILSSPSLVDREVELCVPTILIVLHLLDMFLFLFCEEKSQLV